MLHCKIYNMFRFMLYHMPNMPQQKKNSSFIFIVGQVMQNKVFMEIIIIGDWVANTQYRF